MPRVRTPFNYDKKDASLASALVCTEPSLTDQSFKEECDINTIVKRFNLNYQLPTGLRLPTYGDFTDIGSYHDAVNSIAQANETFDALPAEIRRRFSNDPAEFVDFVSDANNRPEMEKLGLLQKPEPTFIQPVVPVPTGTQTPPAE